MLYQALENVTIDVMAHLVRMKSHGWSDELMDTYQSGELTKAAACYALGDTNVAIPLGPNTTIHHNLFPWDIENFQPKESRRETLIEAIGYLIEEVSRLDRAEAARVAREEAEAEAARHAEAMRMEAEIREKLDQEFETPIPFPQVIARQIAIKDTTTTQEVTVNQVSIENTPAALLAAIAADPNKKVSTPPKPSITAKIIDISDGLKKRSRTRIKNMRKNLNTLFSFA